MSLPQIIGFGAHKAGTSWLFENITRNPKVWRPALKEMHYFNHATIGAAWVKKGHRAKLVTQRERLRNGGNPQRLAHVQRLLDLEMLSLDWYREAYRPCPANKISVDITPAYALLDDAGVNYMKSVLGDGFKSIFLIRDPAARAVSAIRSKLTGKPAEQGMDFWLEQLNSPPIQQRGDYADVISRLDRMLGARNLYLPFGMIKTAPLQLLRAVEDHCGLPEGDYPDAATPRHVSPGFPVPDGVQDVFRDALRPQYDFLEQRFDKAFLTRL